MHGGMGWLSEWGFILVFFPFFLLTSWVLLIGMPITDWDGRQHQLAFDDNVENWFIIQSHLELIELGTAGGKAHTEISIEQNNITDLPEDGNVIHAPNLVRRMDRSHPLCNVLPTLLHGGKGWLIVLICRRRVLKYTIQRYKHRF